MVKLVEHGMRVRRWHVVLSCVAVLAIPGALLLHEASEKAQLSAPPPTLLLLDRHGRYLAELPRGGDALGYWPVDPIPPRVAAAMIAIEDRGFWEHPGVDPRGIARAAWQNLAGGRRISGASTIAMQVARMQDPGPRTYSKKAVEALTALLLVHRYGRERVLAQYLRLAPYGSRTRGIAFAARRYFDKPVEDSSWAEIAFLAAIPQSPSRMNPHQLQGRKRAIERGRRILALLVERGVMTAGEHALAEAQLSAIPMPRRLERPVAAMHAILRLDRELSDYRGDPIVRTTLDLELLEELHGALDEAIFRLAEHGADNGALVVADRESSEVLAYLGSADWLDPGAGAIDFAAAPRPSGSTLKPFIYALALDRGTIDPTTILDDLFRAQGGVSNADDRFLGPLLPRVALANSRNVPAANLAQQIGLHPVYDLFASLELHRRAQPVEHYGAGIALGLLPVSLFDLVSAYGALASEGRLRPLRFTEERREERRVFSANAARQITLFLSDPMARLPTFPRMGTSEYPFPVALKTGTSQAYRDAWTIAYTRRFLIGVWIGRADAKPMNQLGGMVAAGVARGAIERLHAGDFDGQKDLSFPAPEDHAPVRICALSGKVATGHCDRTFVEHLPPEHAHEECDVHVPVAIRSGELRTFVQLPPRYAEWAEQRGLDAPPGRSLGERGTTPPRILRPEDGARIARDPEVPPEQATLALAAAVDPSVAQVVWYVDGRPFAVVGPPFTARWPLSAGAHVFEARIPYLDHRASRVEVIVDP